MLAGVSGEGWWEQRRRELTGLLVGLSVGRRSADSGSGFMTGRGEGQKAQGRMAGTGR